MVRKKITLPQDLDFQEFNTVSPSQWLEQLQRELKGKTYNDLLWRPFANDDQFTIDPYYTHKNIHDLNYLKAYHDNVDGSSSRSLNYTVIQVKNEKEANGKARDDLKRGAEGILFQVHENCNFQKLLENLEETHAEISFEADYQNFWKDYKKSVDIKALGKIGFITSDSGQILRNFDTFTNSAGLLLPLQANQTSNLKGELLQILQEALNMVGEADKLGVLKSDLISKFFVITNIGTNYFLEIAKLRAIQILLKAFISAYDLGSDSQNGIYVFCNSLEWAHRDYAPHENMLKGPVSAMAAIIGGCNGIWVQPEDESDLSSRIALNVLNIIKKEVYLDQVLDPAAGSYFIEIITHRLISETWKDFLKIVEAQI